MSPPTRPTLSRWRKIVPVVLASLAALILVIAARALLVSSKQVPVARAPAVHFDARVLAARLSAALQFRTVSSRESASASAHENVAFASWLASAYPNVHRVLAREEVADGSLLYTWSGLQPDLPAALLLGHMDVVPADESGESKWAHPPFSGTISQNYVWGRGSLDDKGSIIAIFEAVENLIASGFRPRRPVILAFGHDEESGGEQGARAIARLLEARGVKVDALIDEGGLIAQGLVPGMSAPVALIGIAEKGYVDVELRSDAEGGHSSMPPTMTPLSRIARAVDRIRTRPFPAHLRGATRQMFEMLAPEMKPALRTVAANLWLFGPLIEWQAENSPALNAALRTTSVPTIVTAGSKENVVPAHALAVVNFRILPGDTLDSVLAQVRQTIDDPAVRVGIRGSASEPSAAAGLADIEAAPFKRLAEVIRANFPDAVVAPYLVVAATDARHYTRLTRNCYRFLPVRLDRRDLQRMHGIDERIAIRDHVGAARFYRMLIERWSVP